MFRKKLSDNTNTKINKNLKKQLDKKYSSKLFFYINKILRLLVDYIFIKQEKFVKFLKTITFNVFSFFYNLKHTFSHLLTWGRGALGKPFLNILAVFLTSFILLTAGIFRQDLIVKSSSNKNEYIRNENNNILAQPTLIDIDINGNIDRKTDSYLVKEGDTVSSIGRKFRLSSDSIRYANNLYANTEDLEVGDEIKIPPIEGIVYEVKSNEETLSELSEKYSIPSQQIADFNYLSKPFALKKGQVLVLPNADIIVEEKPLPPPPVYIPTQTNTAVTRVTENPNQGIYSGIAYVSLPNIQVENLGTGTYLWPTSARAVTQGFHGGHLAVDIGGRLNADTIIASDSGTVVRSGWWGANGYGNAIQIDHGNGFVTTYAHNHVNLVSVGQVVKQGEIIGMMGTTGRSTGPHIHFTIQQGGLKLNPLNYIR